MPHASKPRPPVLVVHGFLSTASLLRPVHMRLRARGFRTYAASLSPLVVQRVSTLAVQLDRSARDVLQRTGAEQLDVLGLSQGGLVALYWLHELGGHRLTRAFVAVGSPFQGTWAAAAAYPLLRPCAPGLVDLWPGGAFAQDLGQRPLPEGLLARTIALAGDPVSPPARCTLPNTPQTVLNLRGMGPLQHQLLVLSRRVSHAAGDALESWE